ncbi:Protein of unknown function [Cotesia congregata]|uniref:Uncharacterized protein n=1 Tax=Cotesia congregata TaxID=51543 RepID=A0A8J2H9F6_COTCN|nr:Protein of unknown function [Cotesia congregata]
MITRNYLCVLIFFAVTNVSLGIDLPDIYDMDRINSFVIGLNIRSAIDYNPGNKKLNDTEGNKEFKKILIDLTSLLEELNSIANSSEDNYWPNDFYKFIKTLEDYQVKVGYTESSLDLMTYIKQIENKHSAIDAVVRSLIFFRHNNYFSDFIHFCPYFIGFLDFIQNDHYDQSISSVYEDFLCALRTKMASENQHNFCGKTSSFRVGLFNFFRLVMTPFLKRYTMIRFAQIAGTRCQNRSVLSVPPGEFEEDFSNAIRLTKKLLDDVQYYTYRCDVKYFDRYNKDFYYYELEKMIQTIIIEERLMSVTGSCSHNCYLSQLTGPINRTECSSFQECQYITSGYTICKSDEKSSRRYEWFVGRNGEEFGDTDHRQCRGKLTTRDSYYSPSRIRDCDFCVCTCFANSLSKYQHINVISFREQVSDITENKIVVEVRFAKKDNVIHVQIKEGKGNPNGLITNSTWKPLETFKELYQPFRYVVKVNGTLRTLKLGVDYTRPESVNFNNLVARDGFAVTGVKFSGVADPGFNLLNNVRVQFQIRVTPYDYITVFFREEMIYNSPDIPLNSPKNFINSKTDQFIKFVMSDLKKDAGQSTIPFFNNNI